MANLGAGAGSNTEQLLYLPSLRRTSSGDGQYTGMLTSAARLYVAGVDLDWTKFYHTGPAARLRKLPLPTYAFDRQRYWREAAEEGGRRPGDSGLGLGAELCHPILGSVVPGPLPETVYRHSMSTVTLPYLADHRVGGRVILPAAMYVEAALAVGRLLLGPTTTVVATPLTMQELRIEAALEIETKKAVEMQTVVAFGKPVAKDGDGGGAATLQYDISFNRPLVAGQYNSWKRQATAAFLPVSETLQQETLDIEATKVRLNGCADMAEFYESVAAGGLEFGANFRSLASGWTSGEELLTEVVLPESHSAYVCHPIVIDAMLQTVAFWASLNGTVEMSKGLHLPFSIRKFSWLGRAPSTPSVYVHCLPRDASAEGNPASVSDRALVRLYDGAGALLAVLEGLVTVKVTVDAFIRAIRAEAVPLPEFYAEKWMPRLGITEARHDLLTVLQNVSATSGSMAARLQEHEARATSDLAALTRRRTDEMCFYFMVKSVQECGWSWPADVGAPIPRDYWKARLCEGLRGARIDVAILGALAAEGYLSLSGEGEVVGNEGCYHVLRQLPSVNECEAATRRLREEIPLLPACDTPYFEFALHCAEQLSCVLRGETPPLSVLYPADESKVGMSRFFTESDSYAVQSEFVVNAFADLVSKLTREGADLVAVPGNLLRILEVGAGTGASAAPLIKMLEASGIKYQYTFTDISPHFLDKARETFKALPANRVRFSILNIEQDPLTQRFCPSEFDVVLAVHVLHATEDLEASLRNLRAILRPHGTLVICEPLSTPHAFRLSFGLLEGWWRFNDFRRDSPVVSGERWLALLHRSGFSQGTVLQTKETHDLGLVVGRATAHVIQPPPTSPNTWIFFGRESALSSSIHKRLETSGRRVVHVRPARLEGAKGWRRNGPEVYELDFGNVAQFQELVQSLTRDAHAKSQSELTLEGFVFLSLEDETDELDRIAEIQRFKVGGLLHFLQATASASQKAFESGTQKRRPKCFVLVKGVHQLGNTSAGNPAHATVWGAFRSFANETPDMPCCIIDVGPEHDGSDANDVSVEEVCAQLWAAPSVPSHTTPTDKYVLIRGGSVHAHRLLSIEKPRPPLPLPHNTVRHAFINPASGSFADIQVAPETTRPATPRGHEVEVEIRAVALNFRDLLLVLKPAGFEKFVREGEADSDISGVVVAVGEEVTRFSVGDPVFGYSRCGIKSHHIVHEGFLGRKPSWMTFAGAATLPVVFVTSFHCLIRVAKLRPEDRVLIHVATGGVGLAAVQIAQHVGATVFATAGSARKRAYLRQHLGLRHVYHSRSLEFGRAILADTQGAGVTVVLNSLTSPGFKETTLDCCAHGARFVEIGKLNIWSREEARERRPDVLYDVVDLSSQDPETNKIIEQVLLHLQHYYETGRLKPLPFTQFALERVRDAFYHFQEAKHIGKIVVRMPTVADAPGSGGGRLVLKHSFFDPEATYLITGGLGGLGVEVTKWMTSTGAKHIVLAGRRPPSPRLKLLLEEMSVSSGCEIVTSETDVGEYAQCEALLEGIKARGLPPLRGVFLAAGVLADALVQNQSWDNFDAVFRPKVYGAWWLHKLTLHYDLEFFTSFSSITAVVGTKGQAPHAAASRFLDSLAHFRVAQGLPGASINWGAWSDVGAAAAMKLGHEALFGIRAFTPSQGIRALEEFMMQNYTQTCVVDVPDWSVVRRLMGFDTFFADLATGGEEKDGEADAALAELVQQIRACDTNERQVKIQDYLEQLIRQTLRLTVSDVIEPDQSFAEIGVDSLMAMEMRNRLQSILEGTGKTLTVEALGEFRTLRALSTHLAGLFSPDDAKTQADPEEDALLELVQADAKLPEDIRTAIRNLGGRKPEKMESVFVTGATGFLGSHILAQLLLETELRVSCLVRATTAHEGRARLQKAFKKYGACGSAAARSLIESRVEVHLGDVAQDGLGLDAHAFASLATNIDAVIHCAVKSSHLETYQKEGSSSSDSLRSHNVLGTLNLLRLVVGGGRPKAFCHASSVAAVTRLTADGLLTETFPTLDDFSPLLLNGYAVSKLVAEVLIGEAVALGLHGVKVLRYPSIWGHSRTGFVSKGNANNHSWNFFTTCVCLRKFPKIDGIIGLAVVVPVDVAAAVTLELLRTAHGEEGVYNVTTETAVTAVAVAEVMAKAAIEVQFVPWAQWREAVFGERVAGSAEEDFVALRAYESLYEEDEAGNPRWRRHHPLLAPADDGGDVALRPMRINNISEKLRRNLSADSVQGLALPATQLLAKHLQVYLSDS